MAPYLGLMTARGELSGKGYSRKDMSDVAWRVSPPESDGDDLTVFNAAVFDWQVLPVGETVVALAVFDDVVGGDSLIRSEIVPIKIIHGLEVPRGRLRMGHHFRRGDQPGKNIDAAADQTTTDRWREALHRIAEAPVNVRSRELRAIARVALLME